MRQQAVSQQTMSQQPVSHWGMVVDLGRCVGCQTCTLACKMENGLPPGTLWRTVLDVESGQYPAVRRTFVPLTCMHCADPPCRDACPTTATKVRDDGIVWIDNALCIGCGSCVVACPYEARHLVPTERYYFGAATPPELATYDRSRVGICTKCHFCAHKLDQAPAGAVPGRDPAYTPSCASSCIANAIVFGDFNAPDSPVSRLLAERGPGERMLEHLDTAPSVVYLNARELDARPPKAQHSWHKRAVVNFFCGPTGAGLYALAVLAGWIEGARGPVLSPAGLPGSLLEFPWARLTAQQWAGLIAPLLVAIGLLSVAAEAGRPFRGMNVFRNLRRSWMSRESAFAVAFIALAGLDALFWQNPAVQALAALCGLGVALAQGLILSKAKGVPAWNVPIMPLYFLISALAFGAGALLPLLALRGPVAPAAALAGALLALADLAAWRRYLATPARGRTFARAVERLRGRPTRWGVEIAGHWLPAALLLLAALRPQVPALAALAGLFLLAGGLWARGALILKAAYRVDLFEGFGKVAADKAGAARKAA